MSFDIQKRAIFNRRIFIIGIIQFFVFGTIFARLIFLQIFQHKKYKNSAQLNSVKLLFRIPKRGKIYDRNGIVLADSEISKAIIFTGNINLSESKATIKEVYRIIYRGDEEKINLGLQKAIRFAKNNPYTHVMLYKNLLFDEFRRFAFYIPLLKNVEITEVNKRSYKFGYEFAHILGYVKNATQDLINQTSSNILRRLYKYIYYYMGSSGVELSEEPWLGGKFGIDSVQKDSRGNVTNITTSLKEIDGNDLSITLDSGLQSIANKLFAGKEGGVCVLKISTGEILSLYSAPSYDPNLFLMNESSESITNLLKNPDKPFLNRSIFGLYSPGSTIKPCVAMSAIQEKWNPDTKVHCNGSIMIGNRKYHCHKESGHGSLNLSDAISKSCNIYFYTLGLSIDVDAIYENAKNFGYDTVYDLGIGKSKNGIFPNRDWKKKVLKQHWYLGDTVNTAIGQGYTQVNMLQMAVHSARIASGKKIIPNMWKNFNNNNNLNITPENKLLGTQYFSDINISEQAINIAKNGMNASINKEGGSLYNLSHHYRNFEICGKTGTSQVVSKRIDAHLMTRDRANAAHGLFCGYAPFSAPKYAIGLVVEKGIWGSVSAAPISMELLKYCVERNL